MSKVNNEQLKIYLNNLVKAFYEKINKNFCQLIFLLLIFLSNNLESKILSIGDPNSQVVVKVFSR